jgi:hypothetical protein
MSFVEAHRDRLGVEPILGVLAIPVLTFYGWVAQQRRPCQRRRDDQVLLGKLGAVHKRSGGTYGAPRVHAQLRRDGVGSPASGWRGCWRSTVCRGRFCASGGAAPPARTPRRPRRGEVAVDQVGRALVAGSGVVVRRLAPRTTPPMPSSPTSRATWSRPTWMPSRPSCRQSLPAP